MSQTRSETPSQQKSTTHSPLVVLGLVKLPPVTENVLPVVLMIMSSVELPFESFISRKYCAAPALAPLPAKPALVTHSRSTRPGSSLRPGGNWSVQSLVCAAAYDPLTTL